jgi:magnesium-transporting ATPase (P-type)
LYFVKHYVGMQSNVDNHERKEDHLGQSSLSIIPTGKFVPCSHLHYGTCWVRWIQVFSVVFFKALKLYGPIHFIPLLFVIPKVLER